MTPAERYCEIKRCEECGHVRDWKAGRVMEHAMGADDWSTAGHATPRHPGGHVNGSHVAGMTCACPDTTAPTTPAIILDSFMGTGTTLLAAKALGRLGIGNDLSKDYCRLARWRCTDPGELAKAMRVEKPPPVSDWQGSLLDELEASG